MTTHDEPLQEPLFETAAPALARPRAAGQAAQPAPVWLQRMSLVVLVLFCLLIGFELALLPWNVQLWDHNAWFLRHPSLYDLLRRGWARGLVSGLGLLDIWIGISEAVNYRDQRL